MNERILVVDDAEANRVTIERILRREGFDVLHADSGRAAVDAMRATPVDVVLTDLKMPGMTGLELLRTVHALDSSVEVVVMTAYGTVETAVEAMKDGAYDFIAKPLKRAELIRTLRKALEKRALRLENRRLREQLGEAGAGAFIGSSPVMRELLGQAEQVAPSGATVLLTGESGTGKGRLARLIHQMSRRASGRFVVVNCASLPETLLESELFGHEKGAFTGAAQRKVGRFELARGGTIFLDEITEVRPETQVKLLRVLQEGEFERVGGTQTLQTDVRVIAATNRDIEQEVEARRFREDLFYRLNVIRLDCPPLRERQEDIALLAVYFLGRFAEKNNSPIRNFSDDALEALRAWRWPGNVRELENAVERAVVLARGEQIEVHDLPPALRREGNTSRLSFAVGTPLKIVEREMIEATLRHTGGDKILAAGLLGITARTIYRREAEWAEEGD